MLFRSDLTAEAAVCVAEIIACTWPPIKSCVPTPTLAYGTRLASACVRALNSRAIMPLKVRARYRDEADFSAACKEMKLAPEVVAKLNCIHWEQDQTELSSVLIGANPSAVALAHKSGAVMDEDLASIGFREADDIAFLHDSANGWSAADATLRRRIRAELRSIMQPALGSTTLSKNSQSTPPATTREADGEKDAHARKALLAELTRTATRMGRSGN